MGASDDDLAFLSLRALGERLRTRRLTSVALIENALDRLEGLGRRLGAVVTVRREDALREARAADDELRAGRDRGPLHGIPYGAKDLLATRGTPTTWGAAPFREQRFDYDATAIRKLRAAGAVLVAKLALIELAGAFGYDNGDASLSGATRNPWNTDYWAGGSSSGPGAAVAAGLVPYAIGSETSGSIITPAAYSGVSGLRPTYGRVSRYGAMPLSWTLDKLGPMARSADDCGLVLAAIAGRDARDPSTTSRAFRAPEPDQAGPRLRIGVLRDSTRGIQPAVRENFEGSLRELAQIGDIVENVDLPPIPTGPIVHAIIQAEAASSFRGLIESGRVKELRTADAPADAFAGSVALAVDYLDAQRHRTRALRAFERLFERIDVLASPSSPTVAYPLGRDFSASYTEFAAGPPVISAGSVAGLPALAIPNGFGPHRLPTGLLLTGKAWSESPLLVLAAAYQRATDWHQRRPNPPFR